MKIDIAFDGELGDAVKDSATGILGVLTGVAFYYRDDTPYAKVEYRGQDGKSEELWVPFARIAKT